MKRLLFGAVLLMTGYAVTAQELYVFSEPASNPPARSISTKYTGKFLRSQHTDRIEQRHMAEAMLGLSKEWMLRGSTTTSDMYSNNMRWESAKLYTKYRFFSKDDVHKHFRMAAFAEAAYSRNEMAFDELSLDGDNSGVQGGLILTQLWDKLAVSGTFGYLYTFQRSSPGKPLHPDFHHPLVYANWPVQAFNYSISAGYLLFPVHYTSYKQTNVNLYAELIGQKSLDKRYFYYDLAPAIQFIFNSTAKLNAGYRFQLNSHSDMYRMSNNRLQLSFEYVFLNALKKKR